MTKKEKMTLEDYCLSSIIISIVSGISSGSRYKGAYNSEWLDYAINNGYVECNISNSELISLTKKGVSLYRKLQRCVLKDIKLQ